MQEITTILQILEEHRESIKKFGVCRLGIFGSAACNELSDTSDMDVLVEFEKTTFRSYMDLLDYLEGIFRRPVDLVTDAAVKPRMRASIMNEVVYAEGF